MSVGNRLKKARKSLGLSLDDIKDKSKIKKSYLEALENDNYKKLPGEVYTKVYIRGYAKIVGLNPQEILAEYENEKYGSKKTEEETNSKQKKEKKTDQHILNKDGIFKSILGIILILIIILLSYNLFLRPDQSQSNTTSTNQNTEIAQQESKTQEPTTENNSEAEESSKPDDTVNSNFEQETTQEKSNGNEAMSNEQEESNLSESNNEESNDQSTTVNESENNTEENESEEQKSIIEDESEEIKIIATEKSWLSVEVDGELKFQGFINEDEEMTHNGNDNIRIKIGNGIAVLVEYKDETLGPFGKRGEVIVKEFDLNN